MEIVIVDSYNSSSSSSCSSSSNNRTAYLSNRIYNGEERCSYCDMRLSTEYYIASHFRAYCDERCYKNFFIALHDETKKNEKLATEKVRELSEEKNEMQIVVNNINSLTDELLKKNKELKKEIRIRNEGIDKFTLIDLE